VLTLAAAYPLSRALPDFRCMLVLVIASAVVSLVASHVRPSVAYRMAFDRSKLKALGRYGFPLLGAGLLMFAIMNGERFIFANRFGAEALGVYSVAVLLAWTPAGVAGRISLSLGVPLVGERLSTSRALLGLTFALGTFAVAFAAGLGLLAGDLPALLFGEAYRPPAGMMALLASMYGLQALRNAPVATALAEGRTGQIVIANGLRALAVPVGLGVVLWTERMLPLLAVGLGFEVVALVWQIGVAPGGSWRSRLIGSGFVATVIGCAFGGDALMSLFEAGFWTRLATAGVVGAGLAAVTVGGIVKLRAAGRLSEQPAL